MEKQHHCSTFSAPKCSAKMQRQNAAPMQCLTLPMQRALLPYMNPVQRDTI
jgi:hypothetical protein